MKYTNKKFFLFTFFLLFIFIHILFINLIPLWQGPDEPTHFEYIHYLYQQFTLPPNIRDDIVERQRNILDSMQKFNVWIYMKNFSHIAKEHFYKHWTQINNSPPLYYYITAKILSLFQTSNLEKLVIISRYINLIYATFSFFFLWLFVNKYLFPQKSFLSSILFFSIILNPQFNFITSVINSDNLAILINLIFLFLFYEIYFLLGYKISNLFLILLIIWAGVFTKRYLYYLPFILVLLLFHKINLKKHKGSKILLELIVLFSTISLLFLFFKYKSLIYRELREFFLMKKEFVTITTYSPEHIWNYFYILIPSFFFKVGWLTVHFNKFTEIAITLFCLFFFTKGFLSSANKYEKLHSIFFCIFFIMNFISNFFNPARSPQGRYFFPIIPIIYYFLFKGFLISFKNQKIALKLWIFLNTILFLSALAIICYYYYYKFKIYL